MNPKMYGRNSTIGCLVYLDDDSAFETWDGVVCTANIVFNVDGQGIVSLFPGNADHASDNVGEQEYSPLLPIFVPRDEQLFPTLTLHSSQTEVMCRFCSEDILAISRKSIGAPSGVTVYSVDGSVLFDDDLSIVSNDDDNMSCSIGSSKSFNSDELSITHMDSLMMLKSSVYNIVDGDKLKNLAAQFLLEVRNDDGKT